MANVIRLPSILLVGFLCGCSSGNGDAGPNSADAAATTDSQPAVRPEEPANCERWNTAFGHVSHQTLLAMPVLTSDDGYAQQRDPNLFAALKLDLSVLKEGLEVLAEIPNPIDPGPFRQPSEAVAQLREIASLIESQLPSGTPFGDGSGNGEKLLRLLDDFNVDGRAAIHSAMEKAGCR